MTVSSRQKLWYLLYIKRLSSSRLHTYVMADTPTLLTLKNKDTVFIFKCFSWPLHKVKIYIHFVNLQHICRCYCNNTVGRLTTFAMLSKYTDCTIHITKWHTAQGTKVWAAENIMTHNKQPTEWEFLHHSNIQTSQTVIRIMRQKDNIKIYFRTKSLKNAH